MNSTDIEQIVRKVLENIGNGSPEVKKTDGKIPVKSRVAMLTKP